MTNLEIIKSHINNLDLDIRKPNNGRWTTPGRCFDQKNVPELIAFASECIVNFTKNTSTTFSGKDIENMDFYRNLYETYFGKPSVLDSANESNKFIGQQLKLLTAAKVLSEDSNSRPYLYKVKSIEILEMLSGSERTSFDFLRIYIEKLLDDSGILYAFDEYFHKEQHERLVAADYKKLRDNYVEYFIKNTPVEKPTEPKRMVNKLTNILALHKGARGQEGGRPSKHIITFQDLMYRRENSQDANKSKSEPRRAYRERQSSVTTATSEKKSKDEVKEYHGKISEYNGDVNAIEAHHILPKSDFPEFTHTRENLIVLTPNQHRIDAHPMSDFGTVDPEFQLHYLKNKLESIKSSMNKNDEFYNFNFFIDMLRTLYSSEFEVIESILEIKKYEWTYEEIKQFIEKKLNNYSTIQND